MHETFFLLFFINKYVTNKVSPYPLFQLSYILNLYSFKNVNLTMQPLLFKVKKVNDISFKKSKMHNYDH